MNPSPSLHWPPASGVTTRGRVLLVHGLSSLAQTWWRIGPELARRGWDVTAVHQAGHGGRPTPESISPAALADAVLDVYPDGPDVLVGHSLGTITALALLERHARWAPTVVLEEPPAGLAAGQARELAAGVALSVRQDVVAVRHDRAAVERRVRADCPAWADEDVFWAVEGIAQMDAPAFAAWLEQGPDVDTVGRALASEPAPYVLAAVSPKGFPDGGSALPVLDRERLATGLPPGHVIPLEGGHCLHRDAPEAWLSAFERITDEP